MKRSDTFFHRYRWWVAAVGVAIALFVALVLWRWWPSDAVAMSRSVAVVECRSHYEIKSADSTLLCFSSTRADSSLMQLSLSPAASTVTSYSTGCWVDCFLLLPSCKGRLVTSLDTVPSAPKGDLHRLLEQEKARLKTHRAALKSEAAEARYFLRVHSIQDGGYNIVARFAATTARRLAEADALLARLNAIKPSMPLFYVHYTTYKVHYRNALGQLQHAVCIEEAKERDGRLRLLRVQGSTTPADVHTLQLFPSWQKAPREVLVAGHPGMAYREMASAMVLPEVCPATIDDGRCDVPTMLAANGSAVFSARGHFLGILSDGRLYGRKALHRLLRRGDWQ